jgi:hypothetical protein
MQAQLEGSPARTVAAGPPWLATGIRPGPGDGRRLAARPLPDPVAIRLRRIPDAAPPYDNGAPGEVVPARADVLAAAIVAALDGAGPVSRRPAESPRARTREPGPARSGRPAGTGDGKAGAARQAGTDGRARTTGGAGTGGRAGTDGGAGTGGPAGTDGSAGWPSKFAQVLAETLAGSRPPAQLTPWTTERVRSHIRRLGPLLTARQRPVVQRIVTSLPASDVMEMSVVVGFGPRVRALAIRLERAQPRPATPGHADRPPRWLCTAVEAA